MRHPVLLVAAPLPKARKFVSVNSNDTGHMLKHPTGYSD